jgi:twitching motility protein PilI
MPAIDLQSLRERPFDLLQAMEQMARVAAAGTGFATALQAEWIGVGFSIDGHQFVTPRDEVREILQVPGTTRVPGAHGWLLGIANVRGQLITVVDLKDFLLGKHAARQGEDMRALVVNSDEVPSGLVVDEVLGFRRFSEADRVPAPPSLEGHGQDFVVGGFQSGDEVWGIFSFRRLIEDSAFLQAAE